MKNLAKRKPMFEHFNFKWGRMGSNEVKVGQIWSIQGQIMKNLSKITDFWLFIVPMKTNYDNSRLNKILRKISKLDYGHSEVKWGQIMKGCLLISGVFQGSRMSAKEMNFSLDNYRRLK